MWYAKREYGIADKGFQMSWKKQKERYFVELNRLMEPELEKTKTNIFQRVQHEEKV